MKRKPPSLSQIVASLIARYVLKLTHEQTKAMTVAEIMACIQTDHDPVPASIAQDLGWIPAQYNHPSNLTVRVVAEHRHKTNTKDTPQIAKSRRVSKTQEAFRARVLAVKTGADLPVAPARKPKAKIKSRGFQKRPEGAKHNWGKRTRA